MSDKPNPLEALRAQRKFMMYQVIMIPVGIGALLLTAFVAVNLFQGKMTLEAATIYIMSTLAVATTSAVALGLKVIDANTREDEAKIAAAAPSKGPSTVIAAGEGASASGNAPPAPPAADMITAPSEMITLVETPNAASATAAELTATLPAGEKSVKSIARKPGASDSTT